MRIVFMGTPEFAVPSLQALIDNGYEVVGAFTQPDRPSGRGNRLTAFCMIRGMTSSGSVVPEKISIGKYSREAIIPACLEFFATPPTSIPMLKVESMVSSQLPRNAGTEP